MGFPRQVKFVKRGVIFMPLRNLRLVVALLICFFCSYSHSYAYPILQDISVESKDIGDVTMGKVHIYSVTIPWHKLLSHELNYPPFDFDRRLEVFSDNKTSDPNSLAIHADIDNGEYKKDQLIPFTIYFEPLKAGPIKILCTLSVYDSHYQEYYDCSFYITANGIEILPDISLDAPYIHDEKVKCTYHVGDVPWSEGDNNIAVELYFSATGDKSGIPPKSSPVGRKRLRYVGASSADKSETLEFPLDKFPLAPYKTRYLVAIFDSAGKIRQTSTSNDVASMPWLFVEQVPHIQKALGFSRGADLQISWLSGSAAIAAGKPKENPVFSVNLPLAEPSPKNPTPKLGYDTSFSVEWALDKANSHTNRVRDAKKYLTQGKNLTTDESKKLLLKVLKP
ncbi:MAG: hypothetical protein EOO88_51975, partial [Pedobacter sp.]